METLQLLESLKTGNKVSLKDYELLEAQISPLELARALEQRYNFTKKPVTLLKACEAYRRAREMLKTATAFRKLQEEHPVFVEQNNVYQKIMSISVNLPKDEKDITDARSEIEQDEDFRDFLEDSSRFIHRLRKQDELPSPYYDYPYLETEDGFDDSY